MPDSSVGRRFTADSLFGLELVSIVVQFSVVSRSVRPNRAITATLHQIMEMHPARIKKQRAARQQKPRSIKPSHPQGSCTGSSIEAWTKVNLSNIAYTVDQNRKEQWSTVACTASQNLNQAVSRESTAICEADRSWKSKAVFTKGIQKQSMFSIKKGLVPDNSTCIVLQAIHAHDRHCFFILAAHPEEICSGIDLDPKSKHCDGWKLMQRTQRWKWKEV